MKQFLKHYKNPNEDRMNFDLLDKADDKPLVEYCINSFKTLETLKYIKLLEYDFIDDETNIDMNNYIMTRKKKKKKDIDRYQYMDDSRVGELRLKFLLDCNGESMIFTKNILLPLQLENGQYLLKGKKYFMLYQLVDSSTYTTNSKITLKSLMSVAIKRNRKEFADSEGNVISAPVYTTFLFKKEIDVLLFYFAKIGVNKTLRYFSVNSIIKFTEEPVDVEKNIYFEINKHLYIEVGRHFFNKYQYVQSIVFMILTLCTNRVNLSILDDTTYWMEKLGSLNASSKNNFFEKGQSTITYSDRLLDNTTKSTLKVNEHNKKNIYSSMRWMIQNYPELRKKDNMDLGNKRLRCNEYIAALLTMAITERANRIISNGRKNITLDKIKEIFAFPGDIMITQLFKSGLLRYDDTINDMDFYNKLKFTQKGPNSLGNKNTNNISMRYRGIHPSYLGRIDINVCGNSDPGTSGILTPFCKTHGLYFEDGNEPEDFEFDFINETIDRFKETGEKMVVDLNVDNKEDFYSPRFTEYKDMKITRDDKDKLVIRFKRWGNDDI